VQSGNLEEPWRDCGINPRHAFRGCYDLLDRADGADAVHVLPEIPLDARLQGQPARGTPDAGAVKANRHVAVRRDLDEFEVAAIRLHGGPHQVDDPLDLGSEIGCCLVGRWGIAHTAIVGGTPAEREESGKEGAR